MIHSGQDILNSPSRALIERELMKWVPYNEIAETVKLEDGEEVLPEAIKEYHNTHVRNNATLLNDLIKMKKDLVKLEPDPLTEIDKLTVYFSFDKTNQDLDMIYGRIRELLNFARKDPENDTYDKRIAEYLKRAEAIRDRVMKAQYEELRRSIITSIGKKIVLSAVSIFFPFIDKENREKAKKLFVASIESIVSENNPIEPEDIKNIRERYATKKEEEN